MRSRWAWGTFWSAFLLSLCVLGLGLSCLVIEYNTRHISDGAVDFGVRYTLEAGCPQVTVRGKVWPSVVDSPLLQTVLTPPLQVGLALWRALNEGVAYIVRLL